MIGHRAFLLGVLAICLWVVPTVATIAQTWDATKAPFGYIWTPDSRQPHVWYGGLSGNLNVLKDAINERLKAQGLSTHISIDDVDISTRLKFSFEREDHDYVIAEDNTHYRERSAFRGPQAQTLWIKLFMAIAEVSGFALTSIDGHEGFDSGCQLSVTMRTGVLALTESPCRREERLIAAFPKPLEIPIYQGKAEIASASSIPLQITFPLTQIRDISKDFFKTYGVEPTIEEARGFFVIGAYALRNAVLVGENRWEKVTFYISNISGADPGIMTLLIVTDGFYTGGLGQPPPTESYTTPFEPQHCKQLEEFEARFGEYVRERMAGRN